jgi:hypothetical protein
MTMRAWRTSAMATSGLCSAFFMAWAVVLLSSQLAVAQFTDSGVMVSGTDAGPSSALGFSVGLSGDGNLARPLLRSILDGLAPWPVRECRGVS